MKFIGNKISYQPKGKDFSIVIDASVERYELAVLWIWTALWLGVGLYFISYLALGSDLERQFKLFMLILLCFWAFYMYKALTIAMWRLKGYESILFSEDKMTYSVYTGFRFKRKHFFVKNIEDFESLNLKDKSLLSAYYYGFFVKGVDWIHFRYQGKKFQMAKQLNEQSGKALFSLLQKQLARYK